jgi:tRNA nucleotidyltransferase (CCA-adding enzyme)
MNNEIKLSGIPQSILSIMNKIEQQGFQAWLVGGSTRDLLLDREPHDWDICTSAPLEILQSIFLNCKVVGSTFGVVLVKENNIEVQIARFRTEYGYSDYRHPNTILFTDDIMEDLKRRDFTINTCAVNNKGDVICYSGALNDLKNGIIRAVGNASERFNEDALRMLRCLRFSSQLGFQIEEDTLLSICENSHLIKNISFERIQEEFNKILLGNTIIITFNRLYYTRLLDYIIPELLDCYNCEQNQYHYFDVFNHIITTIKYVPNDLSLRLTALFHDIGKPNYKTIDEQNNIHFYNHEEISAQMTEQIMKRLKYDNKMVEEVTYLVLHHMDLMNDQMKTNKGCRKLLNRHGEERLKKLIEFRRADLLGSGTRDQNEVEQLIQSYRDKLEEVLKEKPAVKFDDLVVDGNDIMEITGLSPGGFIGIIKNRLMFMVLEDPELNTREKLIELIPDIFDEIIK